MKPLISLRKLAVLGYQPLHAITESSVLRIEVFLERADASWP